MASASMLKALLGEIGVSDGMKIFKKLASNKNASQGNVNPTA